jgi:hypothetical protein
VPDWSYLPPEGEPMSSELEGFLCAPRSIGYDEDPVLVSLKTKEPCTFKGIIYTKPKIIGSTYRRPGINDFGEPVYREKCRFLKETYQIACEAYYLYLMYIKIPYLQPINR